MRQQIALLLLCVPLLCNCARTAFDDGGRSSDTVQGTPTDPGNGGGGSTPANPVSCSTDGTYVRCVDNGATSSRETLAIGGNLLNKTVDLFLGNDSCQGAADSTTPTLALINLGLPGVSSAIAGATDIDTLASVDLGCGVGLTSYSAIQFSPDCNLLSTSAAPGCDPSSRGTSLDINAFTRQ